MSAPTHADPTLFPNVDPIYPLYLDTNRQQKHFVDVTNPKSVDTFVKLHGLFAAHLVLHEAQVLDHLAMRRFFLDGDAPHRRDLIAYLRTPGPLGLGPLIVASEYNRDDPVHAISLSDLLEIKLGIPNPQRHPWQFASIDPLHRIAANQAILDASGNDRRDVAIRGLGGSEYKEFLSVASQVWDDAAHITRFALDPPDYLGRLLTLLTQAKIGAAEQLQHTISDLHSMLVARELDFADGTSTHTLNQTTVTRWLRERNAEALRSITDRAHPEAFVLALPSRSGWLASNDLTQLGTWRTNEQDPRQKRDQSEVLERVADSIVRADERIEPLHTGGQLDLDSLTYKHLRILRSSDEFQASLAQVQNAWRGFRQDLFADALKRHVNIIWQILGVRKPTSHLLIEGRDTLIRTGFETVRSPDFAPDGTIEFYPAKIGLVFLSVVVEHLWNRSRIPHPRRSLRELANRVVQES